MWDQTLDVSRKIWDYIDLWKWNLAAAPALDRTVFLNNVPIMPICATTESDDVSPRADGLPRKRYLTRIDNILLFFLRKCEKYNVLVSN